MRLPSRFFAALIACLAAVAMASCSGVIGYSVVLWNIQDSDAQIADGTVVPVYVKSNIAHQYVIGVPGTKDKIEVPLWQLSDPDSRRNAARLSERYSAYEHKYAKCVLDGLPIRSDRVNTSKQVYRLRKDEVVRALYEEEGQPVTNGVQELEGVWLRVLTADGTQGWCFSYNLRLFTMNADGSAGEGAQEADVQEIDQTLSTMLSATWYPEYFATMISRGTIDLDSLDPSYGFDTGRETGTVTLRLSDIDVSYDYEGTTKVADGIYKFNGMPIQVTVRSPTVIAVQHTDSRGMPTSYVFTTLDADVPAVIQAERERRDAEYNALVRLGPDFRSTSYGTLSLSSGGSFSWSDYTLLVPSVIARSASGSGTASLGYLLPASFKGEWDGILTFRFDGMSREVNFLYKKEVDGIRLSNVTVSVSPATANSARSVSVTRPANAQVMFFRR